MLCDITIMVCFLNEEGLDMAGDQDFIWVVLTEQTEFQARSVKFLASVCLIIFMAPVASTGYKLASDLLLW